MRHGLDVVYIAAIDNVGIAYSYHEMPGQRTGDAIHLAKD